MEFKKEEQVNLINGEKKKFYQKKWFWIVVVIVLLGGIFGGGEIEEPENSPKTEEKDTPKTEEKKIEKLDVNYVGSTGENVKIDNNSNFKVFVVYDDGSKKEVEDWKITNPTILKAGETSTVTVEYKNLKNDVSIECSTIPLEEFKASCETIDYKELARNGDNYLFTPVKYRGEIIQVIEGDEYTTYRINVTQDAYGWDDTILAQYTLKEGESRFLEDDIVTFYGYCSGLTTYETVMGNEVTIPSVIIRHMELN